MDKRQLIDLLRDHAPHEWAIVSFSFAGTALMAALVLEGVFDQTPCALCISQRFFMTLTAVVAFVAVLHRRHFARYAAAQVLMILLGLMLVARQLWIQYVPGAASTCGPGIDFLLYHEYPAVDVVRTLLKGSGACAEPSVIPILSGLAFLILALLAVMQWFVEIKQQRQSP